jgi:hypothetical protein
MWMMPRSPSERQNIAACPSSLNVKSLSLVALLNGPSTREAVPNFEPRIDD